jgi:hypothetical protein
MGHPWAIFGGMGDWTIYAAGIAALAITTATILMLWFL